MSIKDLLAQAQGIEKQPTKTMGNSNLGGISKLLAESKTYEAPTNIVTPEVNKPESKISQMGKFLFPSTTQAFDSLKVKADPHKFFGDVWNTYKGSIEAESQNIQDLFNPVKTESFGGKIAAPIKLITGAANIAFAPLTALLQGAKDIPILDKVIKAGIDIPFSIAGDVGKDVGMGLVEKLPISAESKKQLSPAVQDLVSLAAQFYLGGKTAEITPKIKETLINKYGSKDAETIVNKATEMAQQKAEHEQTQASAPTIEGVKNIAEQVKSINKEDIIPNISIEQNSTKTQTIEKAIENTPKIETTTPLNEVPNTRSEKLLKAAVEKKLIDSTEGEIATHTKESMKTWANDAVDYINKNPDTYMDIAMGRVKEPNGVPAESIYTAAEIKAIAEGDTAKILELAKSTVPTEAGRGLKRLDSSDPNSPVKIVRDIEKAREEAAQKTLPKSRKTATVRTEAVKKGKAEVKTMRMKLAEAQSLLDKLVC